jgi:hypothetical protein
MARLFDPIAPFWMKNDQSPDILPRRGKTGLQRWAHIAVVMAMLGVRGALFLGEMHGRHEAA